MGGAAVSEQAVLDAGDVGLDLVLGLFIDGQIGDEAQDQCGVFANRGANVEGHLNLPERERVSALLRQLADL